MAYMASPGRVLYLDAVQLGSQFQQQYRSHSSVQKMLGGGKYNEQMTTTRLSFLAWLGLAAPLAYLSRHVAN